MKKKNNDLNKSIVKDFRALLNHVMMIQRKCKENNLWLIMGNDPYKNLTDEEQQGPMVAKLFDMTKNLRKSLNQR
jgi:hypothetical protein